MNSTLLLCAVCAFTAGPVQAELLYAVDGTGQTVYQLDTTTAVATPLASLSGVFGSVGGLEMAPDGFLYAITTGSASRLFRIDPGSWTATDVGPTAPNFVFEGGLAVSSTGDAWLSNAGSASTPEIFTVDLATGGGAFVGIVSGGSHDLNGLACRSDGMLIGLDRVTNSLLVIDPVTAAATTLTSLSGTVGANGGLVLNGATGWFVTATSSASIPGNGSLYQFDAFTGAVTPLGPVSGLPGSGFTGLARELAGVNATAYCFGDGSGTPCPCGNDASAPTGCLHSGGVGAALAAGGSSAASADDLLVLASGMTPGQPALLFAGLNATASGVGTQFGDGLRCAGGSVVRLGVRVGDASGAATWGPGLGVAGGWSAGDVRRMQAWYRDPSNSPCGSAFNLSSGLEVTFD
ncbi:MAG: hypothetical protein H6828_00155 [Planctomycetes bacterium]|nr:hypothetical protein [Planctomycetota bacterium]